MLPPCRKQPSRRELIPTHWPGALRDCESDLIDTGYFCAVFLIKQKFLQSICSEFRTKRYKTGHILRQGVCAPAARQIRY